MKASAQASLSNGASNWLTTGHLAISRLAVGSVILTSDTYMSRSDGSSALVRSRPQRWKARLTAGSALDEEGVRQAKTALSMCC